MSIKFKLSIGFNINFFFAGEIIKNFINRLPVGRTNSWLNRDKIPH